MVSMPGIIAILGSGETSLIGREVLTEILQGYPDHSHITVFDTPAAFQPNSDRVVGKILDFLAEELAEFHPRLNLIRTGKKPTHLDSALHYIHRAQCIIAGPGSPTYMVKRFLKTPYIKAIQESNINGTALYFASAASAAIGAVTLPVYEIYKVGNEGYWAEGLDLLAHLDLHTVIIPHWNNHELGDELDTRFCYIGGHRFNNLRATLPEQLVVIGIDEYTACIINAAEANVKIFGNGEVHLLYKDLLLNFSSGSVVPIELFRSGTVFAELVRSQYAHELVLVPTTASFWQSSESEHDIPTTKSMQALLIHHLDKIIVDLHAAHFTDLAYQLQQVIIDARLPIKQE